MRSENVGISSKNVGEKPTRRKPKVSWATKLVPGLVGPKARPKGVVDGQQANIPALPYVFEGGTHFPILSDFRLLSSRGRKKVGLVNPPTEFKRSAEAGHKWLAIQESEVPRKASKSYRIWDPYRKPTQVGGHKCAKANERTLV